MALWNRKQAATRHADSLLMPGARPWRDALREPKAASRLAVAVGLLAATLLIVELPHPPLPVRKGQIAAHPILARADFRFIDKEATANVRALAALVRVPGVYTPDTRQVVVLRDSLLALAGETAKAAAMEQVPEAARTEWKLSPETFAALKKALGEKSENLAAVQETVTKAFAALAEPLDLPVVREEDYQRAAQRLANIRELQSRLPAGFTPDPAAIPEDTPGMVLVILPDGDRPVPLRSLLMQGQTEAIQARIERVVGGALQPIFTDAGVAAIAASIAPRLGPTLIYEQAQTENRRADVKESVAPVTVLHKANTTLVEAGKEITDADLRLLEQEQEARLAELGWARRALAWVGAAVIIGLLVLLLAVCALRLQPNLGRSFPRSLILAILCVLVLGAAKAVAQGRGPPEFYTFLLATAGMTVTIAYTRVFALALVWTLVFLAAIATRADLDWAITATVGTSVAILALDEINNRLKLIKVGALAGAAFFASRVALAFWRLDYADGNMLRDLLAPALLYFAVGVMTGVVMLAILPFIERAFGITTNISLLELCDVNQPALRRLALEAPGTYTHSLLIGSLAEAAAESIGAHGLLARVGAYFHDIGKALRPRSFGENWPLGEPPREAPTPPTGHEIILAHVKDGLDMADRLGLPPIIRQFIAEHHGTCLLEYFYSEARRLASQTHQDPPPEASYRYPGPKPRSRETAIVMLADAAEAITRSLKERTAPKVSAAVHEIVMKRLLDGQLALASGLTLTDLHTVEETLTNTLLSVYHGRAVYPADRRAAEGPEGRLTRDAGPAVGS